MFIFGHGQTHVDFLYNQRYACMHVTLVFIDQVSIRNHFVLQTSTRGSCSVKHGEC